MKSKSPAQLRDVVQTFIREFGLLTSNQTPCGQSMPISEAHALITLLSHQSDKTRLSAKDLAKLLNIDKSNVSRMCSRMERAGAIKSLPCKSDGRVKRLKLTAKGTRLASQIETASREKFIAVVDALPKSAPPDVISALTLLTEAIRKTSQMSK